jgi:hypothetical protein
MSASYAVYNIIQVVLRFLNTFQAPLLAKTVENSILKGDGPDNWLFFNLCFAAFAGSITGGLFIPTLQRFMYNAVEKVYQNSSVIKALIQSFSFRIVRKFTDAAVMPSVSNFRRLNRINDMPKTMILMNILVTAVTTISVISCLYAGYINPDLRTTSLSLNGFIVGLSTVILVIVVEPHLGITADKVINGLYSQIDFRRYLIFVVIARIIGTGLSIFLLIPLAHFVVFLAKLIYA